MDLHGTLRYRGNKIYLNRKRLRENGDWKWIQDSTGLDKGDEETATKLLAERNARELAQHELRARAARSSGDSLSSAETLRSFARQWVATRKMRELTSAFDDGPRFGKHVLPFVIEDIGELGELPLQQVRPKHIRALVMSLANKLASRSVRNIYSMVHAMFDDAYADERVESNPCRLRRGDLPVSEDKDPRWRGTAVFTREELTALISDPRIPIDRRTLYATAFLGACRSGELSALRVGDYDCTVRPLARLTICQSDSVKLKRPKATKTRVTRLVPVHPTLQHTLDEWLGHGFAETFGRAPRPDDLMFPRRLRGQRSFGGLDCWAMLAKEPNLTKSELARRLGVSRSAVTKTLRRGWRKQADPSTAFRTPPDNYKRFQDDLERLGFRQRRLHDAKRTAVSLLCEDGARDPILTYIAWGPRKNVRDLYITLSWDAFCTEMLKLKLPMPTSVGYAAADKAAATAGQSLS